VGDVAEWLHSFLSTILDEGMLSAPPFSPMKEPTGTHLIAIRVGPKPDLEFLRVFGEFLEDRKSSDSCLEASHE
jgi:predicted acylesterase/phospholipase RssA